jgi:hypothetical protein
VYPHRATSLHSLTATQALKPALGREASLAETLGQDSIADRVALKPCHKSSSSGVMRLVRWALIHVCCAYSVP